MRKTALETDPELYRMLSHEQRRAFRRGSRAQRREEAPPPPPLSEALVLERKVESNERGFRKQRQYVMDVIRDLNREFGVGGGNKDLRRRTALNPA